MNQRISHPFDPVYNKKSKILILGTLPSVKSRENQFYYGHPRNRFWQILSILCKEPLPDTVEEKKALLLKHHIALWDVLRSCEIKASADSTIKNPQVNDIGALLHTTDIKLIAFNGQKAQSLFLKGCKELQTFPMICLPSTSPANAAFSKEKLLSSWSEIEKYLC